MDRDEFMELVYETFADEPDNVLANGIVEAADAYVEYEKAQLSQEGEWIRNDNGTYSCNLCHSWIPGEQYFYARYCLYCGAKMRGEKDG